jgi:D-3-phosphoglycerate dehydrogenase
MIGQMTTILAENNLNILNMVNKSKGEIAYNVIDVDSEPSKSVIEGLSKLDGVITVRILSDG